MTSAYVDSREPDSIKLAAAKGNANGRITFDEKELPQGDFYLPEKDVVIERKDASDFASSTTEGRLSEQADRMIAEHDHCFVIIENDVGTYFDGDTYKIRSLYDLRYSHIGYKSLIGMQTSLAVKRGIKIIYTESEEQTLYAVERIFERFLDEEHEQTGEGYVKTHDAGEVDDVQVAMLMQIDGISRQKAEGILREIDLHELAELANDYEVSDARQIAKDAVRDVDGIGPTLAERVINAFQ